MEQWYLLLDFLIREKGEDLNKIEFETAKEWYKNALTGYVHPLKDTFDFITS